MKKTLLAGLLACLASSSCLGPDHLYGSVKNWNADLSDQDWVNEVVFLGLIIVPVYPIALMADTLLFNTVHYWTGKNWIKAPGEFPGFVREKK